MRRILVMLLLWSSLCFAADAAAPIKVLNVSKFTDEVYATVQNVSDKPTERVEFHVRYLYKENDPNPLYQAERIAKEMKPGQKKTAYWIRQYQKGMPEIQVVVTKVVFKDGSTW